MLKTIYALELRLMTLQRIYNFFLDYLIFDWSSTLHRHSIQIHKSRMDSIQWICYPEKKRFCSMYTLRPRELRGRTRYDTILD